MRLDGLEQVSHKTLSELIAELELCGFVEEKRKERGRGREVDFYISPTESVERKALLDAQKGLSCLMTSLFAVRFNRAT